MISPFGSSLLLAAFLSVSFTAAQSVTTSSVPSVPTGAPVPGDYTGPLRPQIHFSPPQHFMNDPNGLFRDSSGTYHLYYQYNPTGLRAGNQHWGHATSPDLYHWTNQPIALFPPSPQVYVFSGSCVVDANNTSGFFPSQSNGVVAMFTLAEYNPDGSAGPQTQNIAYSLDGGYTFRYYDGNPVIGSTSSQFRDPKVLWHSPTQKWVAVVAYSQDFVVGIFTSPDLRTWSHASNFSHHGLLGTQYECPNLVAVPVVRPDTAAASNRAVTSEREEAVEVAYVLTISVQPGAPLGGSATQYFPGDFNGTHFVPFDAAARLTDFGKDNYAAQFFSFSGAGRSDAVSLGWASNWQYAQDVPTGQAEGWRSAMTLPRRSRLAQATRVGWVLVDEPFDIAPVLDDDVPLARREWQGGGGGGGPNGSLAVDYAAVESNALYVEVNVTGLNASQISASSLFTLSFSSPVSGESLRSGFYFGGDQPFFVDRGLVRGFDNVFFTDKFSAADVWDAARGEWRFKGIIDRSMYEVFVDGGVHAGTFLFYPTEPLTLLSVATAGMPQGARVSVAVWGLKSVWAQEEDGNGNVTGSKRDVYEADFRLPDV